MSDIYGFSGSSEVITEDQCGAFIDWIDQHDVTEFRHGDCIVADAFAHRMVRQLYPKAAIIGHIPDNPSKRAFCDFDVTLAPLPYLERNHAIVDACDLLLAMPKGGEARRSGTWATIRYANKYRKPVLVFWPDGTTQRIVCDD